MGLGLGHGVSRLWSRDEGLGFKGFRGASWVVP